MAEPCCAKVSKIYLNLLTPLGQPMLPTYPAILRDGRLEWGSEGGPPVSPNQPIPVHVTVLAPEPHPAINGEAMAAALGAIAAAGGPASVDVLLNGNENHERTDCLLARLIYSRCGKLATNA